MSHCTTSVNSLKDVLKTTARSTPVSKKDQGRDHI